jgi:hypothetical protein
MGEKILPIRLFTQFRLKIFSLGGIVSCIILGTAVFFPSVVAKFERALSIMIDKKCLGISIKNIIIDYPFVSISFIFVLYLVKNIFLVMGAADFNIIVLIMSIFIHSGISFAVYRKRNTSPLPHLAACYGILILSLLISTIVFDYSWDGQAYHQTAVQYLKNGWNPFLSNLPETSVLIWDNHYPKFTWIFSSIFSDVFKNIEFGKSYNIIFLMISFCYALKHTAKYQKNKLAALAISILFTMNPVVLAQLFTYYVDGFVGMLIIILFFACIDYEQRNGVNDIIVIIAVSIFAINTKFTGFICGIVLIGYIIRQLVFKKGRQAIVLIVSGIIVLAIGVLFTGYNPYITNFRDFGHPFYPLYGSGKIDIIYNGIMPENLVLMHPIQRFFSLFLLDYKIGSLPFNPLKIITLTSHNVYDKRVAGFGIFLIEISFIIGFIILLSIKKNKHRYKPILFPAILLLCISIIGPENWMARYIPFFWYLFGFFIMTSDYSGRKNKNLFFMLSVVIIVNNVSFLYFNSRFGTLYTTGLKQFLTEIDESDNDTIHIILEREYFKYAVSEKIMFYGIEKNIVFIEDRETSFANGVAMSYIRGWY